MVLFGPTDWTGVSRGDSPPAGMAGLRLGAGVRSRTPSGQAFSRPCLSGMTGRNTYHRRNGGGGGLVVGWFVVLPAVWSERGRMVMVCFLAERCRGGVLQVTQSSNSRTGPNSLSRESMNSGRTHKAPCQPRLLHTRPVHHRSQSREPRNSLRPLSKCRIHDGAQSPGRHCG